MSRIGKMPIQIPAKVEVSLASDNTVTVKGPKGSLSQKVDPDISVQIEDGTLSVTRRLIRSGTKPYTACIAHCSTTW